MNMGLAESSNILGVAFGPGYPLIRLQALGAGPVSAANPNAGCLNQDLQNLRINRMSFPSAERLRTKAVCLNHD